MKLTFLRSKWVALALGVAISVSCVSKKKYQEALTRAAAEKSALQSQIDAAEAENEKLKAEAAKLQQNLNMSAEEIAQLSEKIKQGNKQLDQLKAAIAEVFPNYDGITVEERNGKLYVSLSNAILFESGDAKLTKGSKEVIGNLAQAFKNNPGLFISVEGHTDNEPIRFRKDQYKDNWQLSVARSLSVVRELQAAGVDPASMTASGKGEIAPIASNETKEGREKNRRTEFVVSPKIDGLYRMYKSGFSGVGGSGSN